MDGALTSRAADDGFTLIELLIAVAVLSVLAVGATLALPGSARDAQSDADRFREAHEAARDLAVQGQIARGLALSPRGYRPARLSADGWRWTGPEQRWTGRVSHRAPLVPQVGGPAPDLVFLPNGRTTAFEIDFARGPRCRSDGWTGLSCDGG